MVELSLSKARKKKALLLLVALSALFNSSTSSPFSTCDPSANCYACVTNGGTDCAACNGTYFLNGTACVTAANCPSNTFASANKCQTCHTDCATCDGPSNADCVTCPVGKPKLYNGTCLAACPSHVYEDGGGVCHDCNSNCFSCNTVGVGPTSCKSCDPDVATKAFLNGTTCKDACDPGFYETTESVTVNGVTKTTKTCTACDSTCKTCATSSTNCLTCDTTAAANNKFQTRAGDDACVTTCDDGFWDNSNTCAACTSPCAKCSTSATTCTACIVGQFLHSTSQCTNDCPGTLTNFFNDTSPAVHACTQCHASCSACTSAAATDCTGCAGTKIKSGPGATFSCLDACPTNKFKNATNNTCEACSDSDCDTCTNGSAGSCTACSTKKLHNGACVTTCPAGTFDVSNVCESCHSSCATCVAVGLATASSPKCDTCAVATPKYIEDTGKRICSAACPTDGYYAAGDVCTACGASANCKTCSDGTTCDTCDATGSFPVKDVNVCVASCPAGKFNNAGTCQSCDTTKCKECVTSATNCTACPPTGDGTLVNLQAKTGADDVCVATGNCDSGFYENVLTPNTCTACQSPCATCSGAGTTACLTCIAGKKLEISTCVDTCTVDGFYTSGNNCLRCHPDCKQCSGPNNNECTACPTGKKLQNGSCVDPCSAGYFTNGNQCDPCHTDCKTCDGAANTQCLTCHTGVANSILQIQTTPAEKKCVAECETGFVFASPNCVKCDASCVTCSGTTSNDCVTCPAGNFLDGGACGTTCPTGKAKNVGVTPNACTPCRTECATTCKTDDFNKCVSCDAGGSNPYLVNEVCQATCPATGYSPTPGCKLCDTTCATCTDSGSTNCASCSGTTYLSTGNACVSDCGDGFLANTTTNICDACDSTCRLCSVKTDATKCTHCKTAAPKLQTNTAGDGLTKKCVASCETGYYESSTDVCSQCHSSCLNCNGPAATECTACPTTGTKFIQDPTTGDGKHQCTTVCDTANGYLIPAGANVTCPKCHSTCQTCSAAADQTKCSTCPTTGTKFKQDDGNGTIKCVTNCVVTDLFFAPTGGSTDCLKCDATCATCNLPTDANKCKTCPSGKRRQPTDAAGNFKCVTTCEEGFYPISTDLCGTCSTICKTCTGPSSNECTSCKTTTVGVKDKKKGTTCVDDCGANWFLIPASNPPTCDQCHSTCLQCSGTTSTQCLDCDAGGATQKLQDDGKCVATCDSAFYQDNKPVGSTLSATHLCKPCDTNCATCSGGASNNCLTCKTTGNTLFHTSQTNCVSVCPPGSFQTVVSTVNVCSDCHTASPHYCATCLGTATTCKSCVTGSAKPHFFPDSITNATHQSKCFATCPDHFYSDSASDDCKACVEPCSKCTSATDCTECTTTDPTKRFLQGTACQHFCDDTYYENGRKCYSCDASKCGNCIVNDSKCISCRQVTSNPNKLLHVDTFTCIASCPDGTFKSGLHCRACKSPCVTCNLHKDNCKSCEIGLLLHHGNCVASCPSGFYRDGANCLRCSGNCATCERTSTICHSCRIGLFLHDTTCVSKCPSGTISYGGKACVVKCPDGTGIDENNTCQPCDSACSTCDTNKPGSCTTCVDPKALLFNGTCVEKCPSTTYKNDKLCVLCPTDCNTCIRDAKSNQVLCTSCVDPLKTTVVGKCRCMPGTIANNKNECIPEVTTPNTTTSGTPQGTATPVTAVVNENQSSRRHSVQESSGTIDPVDSAHSSSTRNKVTTNESLSEIRIEKTYFVRHNRTAIVKFSDKVDDVAVDLLRFSMKNHRGQTVKNFRVASTKMVDDLELQVELNLHTEVKDNKLEISTFEFGLIMMRSNNEIEFNKFPIEVKINYYENEIYQDLIEYLKAFIFIVAFVVFILAFFLTPTSAILLLKTTQILSLVRFFKMKQPNNLFYFTDTFADNVISIIYNPLYTEPKMTPQECGYAPEVTDEGLECNLFNNIGVYVLILAALFAIKAVIFVAYHFDRIISKASSRESGAKKKISEFLSWLNSITSFHYILRIFFMMEIDLFIGSWGVLKYQDGFPTSFYLGLAVLICFGIINLGLAFLAFSTLFVKYKNIGEEAKNFAKDSSRSQPSGSSIRPKPSCEYGPLVKLIEGNGYQFKWGSVYVALFAFRDMLAPLLVLFFSDNLYLQTLPLLASLIIEFIFVLTNTVFASRIAYIQRLVSVALQSIAIVAMLIMDGIDSNFSEKTNYYLYGSLIISLMTLNVVSDALFAAYHMIYVVRALARNYSNKDRDGNNLAKVAPLSNRQFKKVGYEKEKDGLSVGTNSQSAEETPADVNKLPLASHYQNDSENSARGSSRKGAQTKGILGSNRSSSIKGVGNQEESRAPVAPVDSVRRNEPNDEAEVFEIQEM